MNESPAGKVETPGKPADLFKAMRLRGLGPWGQWWDWILNDLCVVHDPVLRRETADRVEAILVLLPMHFFNTFNLAKMREKGLAHRLPPILNTLGAK